MNQIGHKSDGLPKVRPQLRAMKILPHTRQEWLGLLAIPFKGYIIGVALVYPYWCFHMTGGKYLYNPFIEGKVYLSQGYFVSFVALIIAAALQMFVKDRRGATWSFLFALVALCAGVILTPPNMR